MKKISILVAAVICASLLTGGVFAAMTKSASGEGKVMKKVQIKRVKKVVMKKTQVKGSMPATTTAK